MNIKFEFETFKLSAVPFVQLVDELYGFNKIYVGDDETDEGNEFYFIEMPLVAFIIEETQTHGVNKYYCELINDNDETCILKFESLEGLLQFFYLKMHEFMNFLEELSEKELNELTNN